MQRINSTRKATTLNEPNKEHVKRTNVITTTFGVKCVAVAVAFGCFCLTVVNIFVFHHMEQNLPKFSLSPSSNCSEFRKPTVALYGKNVRNIKFNINLSLVEVNFQWTPYSTYNATRFPNLKIGTVNKLQVDSGYLRHVLIVFDRLGFQRAEFNSSWDVLWAHEYPFRAMYSALRFLKSHQKVNHFPGSGYITNKVELSITGLHFMPPAFKIPQDKEKLFKYVNKKKNAMFVQKDNNHRGVTVKHVNQLDLTANGSFVQEFIDKPFLIDGHKFDIGVYTVLTSVDPLRLYVYKGDVLFRFCPEKYHPFDSQVENKYVVGDDYLPIWKIPSLKKLYDELGFSMKDSFDAYLAFLGKDPNKVWKQVDEAIRQLYLQKEPKILQSVSHYHSRNNFFEMVRIDFVIDEDLNVFLMECRVPETQCSIPVKLQVIKRYCNHVNWCSILAGEPYNRERFEANMSPNLSSAHFPPNRLLYEQVIFNTLSLVGVARQIHRNSLQTSFEEEDMLTGMKHILVNAPLCSKTQCSSCIDPACQLCHNCLTPETVHKLKAAYKEHINRYEYRRVFPPPVEQRVSVSEMWDGYSPENQLMIRWFLGKCVLDESWCS